MKNKRLVILTLLALSLILFKINDWQNSLKSKFVTPSAIAQPAPTAATPITILQKPVLVRLQQKENEEYLINVDFKDDHYSITADGYERSLNEFLKTFGWKEKYLFVHSWNGCGSCHRGITDHVYKFKNGHLIELGEIRALDNATKPGVEYKNGVFEDLYNKFEMNDVTGHFNSPDFLLAIRDKNGKFVIDLNETWLRNKNRYFELKKKLEHISKLKPDDAKDELPDATVLGAAVIAKYCNQDKELKTLMKYAKNSLPMVDSEKIETVLKQVIPGELGEFY